MLIFEIVDWFLLVFLIFGRELRSLIFIFWTFIHSTETRSVGSFISSSLGWDSGSMFNTSWLRPFWTLLLICSRFTEFGGEECSVIQHPYSAVLYDVGHNEKCYYWSLHLVTGFDISIIPSILFHRFSSQKDICFL